MPAPLVLPRTPSYTPEEVLKGLKHLPEEGDACGASSFLAEEAELHPHPEDAWCLSLDVPKAFAQLSPQQQEVVRLCLTQGLLLADAARKMGISRQNVGRHLHAGVLRVMQSLGACSADSLSPPRKRGLSS